MSLLVLLWACSPPQGPAQVEEPPAAIALPQSGHTRFELGFERAHAHLMDVTATYPTNGAPTLEVMMATWTPGSYLIREYAQHVEGLQAPGHTVRRTAKNRWTIDTNGADAVALNYTVYAREMTVRNNFVDADLAMLNGAPTFIVPVGRLDQPAEVVMVVPETWTVATAFDPVEGQENTWLARDFDELVDTPIVAGTDLAVYPFEVQGVPHQLVNWGEDGIWDGERSAEDVQKITEVQIDFWGSIPYDRYLYLNVLGNAGGGLEHKRSTLMLADRWRTDDEAAYKRWLGLVSHEFFHTWNVKRLRPVELGPFDYESEVHTENLWIAEGFTSYYDDLLLVRAGLLTEDEWIGRMSDNIDRLQTTPGRLVHPLSEASRDSWVKFYRPNENSRNTTISYYTKGAVVAWLLDARIREATAGQKSLDDVMRLAYDRYSDEQGFTTQQFRDVCSEVARTDLTDFFASTVDSTDELDYSQALAWFGFEMAGVAQEPEADPEDTEEASDEEGWIGLELSGGTVRAPLRGTPAFDAGFNAGDELLAIDGFRADSTSRVSRYQPGETIEVLISRRGKLRSMTVTVGKEPKASWSLTRVDDDPGAVSHRKALLATP